MNISKEDFNVIDEELRDEGKGGKQVGELEDKNTIPITNSEPLQAAEDEIPLNDQNVSDNANIEGEY